jgi:23S rRNA (uracil1939-C5)-methyltransferase
MPFKPTDFTQVNPHINRVLVTRALGLLAPQAHERVIDWFCGLGNFTLPLATRARQVHGIEGSEVLVQRARDNARANGLAGKTQFEARNLFEIGPADLVAAGRPSAGWSTRRAKAPSRWPRRWPTCRPHPTPSWQPPRRIVYVSCNPATLARDAGLLVHQAGYRCTAAGVVNMFPHTAHVESIAVFDRAA